MYKLTDSNTIIRTIDNAYIPKNNENSDYKEYVIWTANNTATPADIPAKVFQPLSAWQVRKVLTQFNMRAAVEAGVAAADQNTRDAWAYAREFQRDDPVLVGMATALGMTNTQIDSMFDIGITL